MPLGDKLRAFRKAVTSPITSRLAFGLDVPSIELHQIDTPFQGLAVNAFPDKDCVPALQKLKADLGVQVVAIRLPMDLKDLNGENSSITPEQAVSMPWDDLVKVWLDAAQFSGDTLRDIGKYCEAENISIVFTFNYLPHAFTPNNTVGTEVVEGLARLTAAGIAAFFRAQVPLWGVEILNEPSADPEWGIRCVPKVFAHLVDKVLFFANGADLPYTPKLLIAGVHNVFNDCHGYIRELAKYDNFHTCKKNICFSYHFYERGYDINEHEKAFWSASKLSDYAQATMLSSTEEDNKRYLESFGGVFPMHVTEIATHLYHYPHGFQGDATNIQSSLQYSVAVAQNIIATISAGQGPLYLWLLKDYYWFGEKWGLLTEKNEVDFEKKPLALFLKMFSEGVRPGSTVFSCMNSPKSSVDSVRAVAFESKVTPQPMIESELQELKRQNSLYFNYQRSSNDGNELTVCIAALCALDTVNVRVAFPSANHVTRISAQPLKIVHSPIANTNVSKSNQHLNIFNSMDCSADSPIIKVKVANPHCGTIKCSSTSTYSTPGGTKVVVEKDTSDKDLSSTKSDAFPRMIPINDTEIVVDLPGMSYVFLYFAMAY